MKYILKKDLPFAEAGEEVIVNSLCVYTMGDLPDAGNKRITKIYLGDIPELLESGWIEEAKPRDYFISLKQDGMDKWWLNDVAECREDLRDGGLYKIIKVREVIE